jgi:hypothetical protein
MGDMTIRPLEGKAFGATVTGPDLRSLGDDEFAAILGRIQAAGIPYRSDVAGAFNNRINHDYGGSLVYWNEPDGHQWEILTVSYARQ